MNPKRKKRINAQVERQLRTERQLEVALDKITARNKARIKVDRWPRKAYHRSLAGG